MDKAGQKIVDKQKALCYTDKAKQRRLVHPPHLPHVCEGVNSVFRATEWPTVTRVPTLVPAFCYFEWRCFDY